MNNCTAIITASGKGARMGEDIPKQFIEIKGKPILAYTIEKFQHSSSVDEIIIVAGKDYMAYCKEMAEKYSFNKVTQIIEGGASRQLSVYEGLKKAEKAEYVLIHDGVRPLVSLEEIENAYKGAVDHKAFILAAPCEETVKLTQNGMISKTLDRTALYFAKTPQGFSRDILLRANEIALRDNFTATDDASLMEYSGIDVYIGEGAKKNIKITTKEDLALFEYYLSKEEDKEKPDTEEHMPDFSPKEQGNLKSIDIYTDGACSGNPGRGGYGAVILYGGKRKEISEGYEETTNNRMEMMAVIKALALLKEPCKINLYSDSKYVVDAISKGWAAKWKKNNWMRTKTEPALNADLWQKLMTLLERHKVNFIWVKGHSTNKENNRCDELARAATASSDLNVDLGYKGK